MIKWKMLKARMASGLVLNDSPYNVYLHLRRRLYIRYPLKSV
jgi:hypothetical protein